MTFLKEYVIVSGASGFIGKHLLEALKKSGISVVAITRDVIKNNSNALANVRWCSWDNIELLVEELSIDSALIGIIHLATEYGHKTSSLINIEDANVIKPLKLLDLAIKYRADIFLNTDSFFAKKDFNYQHMRPYIITKRHFDEIGHYYANMHDISFVNMRLEHVYGPGDGENKFIPYIIDCLNKKQSCVKCTTGEQIRDFIFVDDVVNAYLTILENRKEVPSYTEYQVGTGAGVSLKDFLVYLQNTMMPGSSSIFEFGAIEQRDNEIMFSVANNKNLKAMGWKPNF
ncbi:CDP-abequose synthase, partial [Salmonella enterica]